MQLEAKSLAELTAIYNTMTGKELKGFSQKSVAIEKITQARVRGHDLIKGLMGKTVEQGATAGEEESSWTKITELVAKYFLDPNNYKMPPAVKERLEPAATVKPDDKPAEKPKAKSGRIIRVACEELLMKVDFEQGGKEYGLSYEDILAAIKAEFPNGKTSLACLRWYAVQLRERNEKVPNRPRAPKKDKAA